MTASPPPNRFARLFEPIQIGPVTAPNRFYQVPHCNGLGYRRPQALAAMRAMKAEGGWGVICTEDTEIHPSADQTPFVEGRLWDDKDIPGIRLMTDAVHAHGALAGVELAYMGLSATNYYSRVPVLSPRSMSLWGGSGIHPGQSRRMDKDDIRNLRRWHREAALRAKKAGFDIVYIYSESIFWSFFSSRYNDRSDEYGGSLENRIRLFREVIEDIKEAVGDTCAIAVRMAVDELQGDEGMSSQGEGYDIVGMLAELPDLWDVNITEWQNDSASSRFAKEGHQERYVKFVKELTTKPVVGVGRFTSPETMLSLVERGILDLIGAARPSIADPFLPKKIQEGRIEDIRECIGCNICVTSDFLHMPIRCTQNPTMGEEWKRGWHPERIQPKKSEKSVLVVGAGPAGLECVRALGDRGYQVLLTEARRELGGRVILESQLPGLIEWRRVVDWRLTQIEKMTNVAAYPGSPMTAADVLEAGIPEVIIATGASWRRDGVGRSHSRPIPGSDRPTVFSPDDIMRERLPQGRVVIFDDDHYYMGGVIAEKLAEAGCDVTLMTPAAVISDYLRKTLEQEKSQRRLLEIGVVLRPQVTLEQIHADHVVCSSALTGIEFELECDGVVLVSDRLAEDGLYQALRPHRAELGSLQVIGDAAAPHIIERAVFAGHLAARDFEESRPEGDPFKIERFPY
jgi:dimethylamine/trimethylamine dehydrogenase